MKLVVLICLALPGLAVAAPSCVNPQAGNYVIASSRSELADGWPAQWLLQKVDSPTQIILRRCSERKGDDCYFAVNAEPGMYYFKEVIPGVKNTLQYPVSKPDLWFEITAKGVDYIGDWNIERSNRRADVKLKLSYSVVSLEKMMALCGVADRKLFLGRTKTPSLEIVN